MDKPVAIVLGGIVPHMALLEKLKERGYYTVLIDYYEDPPAKPAADLHLCESTLDPEAVERAAREYDAKLITGFCVDQAMVVSCCISEKLGLPVPFSYKTSVEVTNKSCMKQIMRDAGIPTSDFIITDDVRDKRIGSLSFPLVVKPVDNNGSKGVKKVDNREELLPALENALSLSRAGQAVVEGFNEGDEIQIDCFIKDGRTHVLMTRKRLKIKSGKGDALQSFGSLIPSGISDTVKRRIEGIAADLARAFKLNNTPFFIQTIVNGEDVKVLEFAPRVGGSLSYTLIKMITGFDIFDGALGALLESDYEVSCHEPERLYATNIMYASGGVFGCITGDEELLADGTIDYYFSMRTRGMELGSEMDSRNRVACYIISGEDQEELLAKAAKAHRVFEVYDIDGKPIMRKDLALTRRMLS